VASRLSGDEFAFFLPDGTAERGMELAEAIRAAAAALALDYPRAEGGGSGRAVVTVSVGMAISPEDGDSPEALVAAADRALYAAKEGGRNRVARAGRR
jgi:diguanylate cyclase (GGDEF)-like protein